MITEEEARLFYKNKAIKALYLLSYILLGIFSVGYLIFSGIAFIVENGSSPSHAFVWLTITAVVFGISLILTIITLCMAFIDEGDGFSPKRIRAVNHLKFWVRLVNTIGAAFLLLSATVGEAGKSQGNIAWNNFLITASIVLLCVEGIMTLYSLWRLAWTKENPERYGGSFVPAIREEKPVKKQKNEVVPTSESKKNPPSKR